MRKIILFSSFLLMFSAKGQSIDKNINGVQIGLFGVNIYNETKLYDNLSLRIDAHLQPKIWNNSLNDTKGFLLYPLLNLEPRFYYNISKRFKKEKDISNNAGNYFSIQFQYIPNWFAISNIDNVNLNKQLNIIPTYGLRRNFTEKFNYELKFGYGYSKLIDKNYNESGSVLDLSFKVGYIF